MFTKPANYARFRAAQPSVSRRGFLLGALAAGGGLAVGFRLAPASEAKAAAVTDAAESQFSPYVLIDQSGKVTVLSSQFEMGQGSYNGIATLVAEELDADWSTIEVLGAAGDVKAFAISPLVERSRQPAAQPRCSHPGIVTGRQVRRRGPCWWRPQPNNGVFLHPKSPSTAEFSHILPARRAALANLLQTQQKCRFRPQ